MIKSTYAIGGTDIHGQRTGGNLTLCGMWASDVKPMSASGTITCPDCDVIRRASERAQAWEALGAVLAGSGIRAVAG